MLSTVGIFQKSFINHLAHHRRRRGSIRARMPSYEPVKGDEAIGSSRSSKSKYLRVAVIGIVATLGIFMLTSMNSSNEAELGHKHKSAPEPTAAPTIEDSLGFCCFYGGCDDCKAKANGFCGQSPENCATCTGSYCSNPTL